MRIPSFLEAKYRGDHRLNALATSAWGKIEAHIASSRMVFFPEYTDHGVQHTELTLQTALDSATARARELITASDASCLTIAVGLHDLGMHLTKDGFESLIAHNSAWKGLPYFDRKS